MTKRSNITMFQSSLNKLRSVQQQGETYNDTILRLIELEEASMGDGFHEDEFNINYNEVDRVFKVKFVENGIDEIKYFNPSTLKWENSLEAWQGFEQDHAKQTIEKYIVKFMDKFVRNSKNFVMLDVMGDKVDYNDLTIRRI